MAATAARWALPVAGLLAGGLVTGSVAVAWPGPAQADPVARRAEHLLE